MKRWIQTVLLASSSSFIAYFALTRASNAQNDQPDSVKTPEAEIKTETEAPTLPDDATPPMPEPAPVNPEY